jgi:hypothetical protein
MPLAIIVRTACSVHGVDRVGDDGVERHRLALQGELPVRDAAHIQEIVRAWERRSARPAIDPRYASARFA